MQKLTPFVVKKIEEKLSCSITDKGACAELRRKLVNAESDDGRFSLNTIKRWFGIIEKQVEPQQNGLEAIAQYLDYPSWAALTLEPEYNQTKIKKEEDYISELLPEYTILLQGIQDYQFKKEQAKTKKDILHCKGKIEELKKQQNTIKDAIVQLSNILTDSTPYKSDLNGIEKLFENKHYEEANRLLDEDRLKEEQAVLLRSLKKKDHEEAVIQSSLNKNAYCFYIKAEICKSFNQLNEAEEFYLLSLESVRVFNTLFNLGEFYLRDRQDNKQALIYFDEIKSKQEEVLLETHHNYFFSNGKELSGPSIFLNTLFYLGKIYLNQKDFEKGNKTMDSLLSAYSIITTGESNERMKDVSLRIADVYNEQGNALLEEKDAENSIIMLKKALEIYKPYCKKNFAETAINLAYSYIEIPNFEAADKLLNQSHDYFSSNSRNTEDDDIETKLYFRLGIAKSHYAFGYLYKRMQNYESALKSFKRALAVFEKMDKIHPSLEAKLETIKTWREMGSIYEKMGNQEKYDECYEKMGDYLLYEDVLIYYIEPVTEYLKENGFM